MGAIVLAQVAARGVLKSLLVLTHIMVGNTCPVAPLIVQTVLIRPPHEPAAKLLSRSKKYRPVVVHSKNKVVSFMYRTRKQVKCSHLELRASFFVAFLFLHLSLLWLGTVASLMLCNNLGKPPGSFQNGLEKSSEVFVRKVTPKMQPISAALSSGPM